MQPLSERYRPATWDAVVGQDAVVKTLLRFRDRGQLGGRAYWLSGKSSSGKTSIARLIAAELCDDWTEKDASAYDADLLRDIERGMWQRQIGAKTGRVWVCNEAHGMRKEQVRRWLSILEPDGGIPSHVAFIFTTTSEQQDKLFEDCLDAHPLLSRCTVLEMAQRGFNGTAAKLVREIALKEGLDGKPERAYLELANQHRGNIRAMLQFVEAGGMLD